jgi:hypothetical protein
MYRRCAKTAARDALANDGCLRTVVRMLIDVVPQADGTTAVTQQWSLAPLIMTSGGPFCTRTWTGTMTAQPIP